MRWDPIQLLQDKALATRIGQVGPRGAGPTGAEYRAG